MERTEINIDKFDFKEFEAVIIGSGAAGLNCAIHLVEEGLKPSEVAIITENLGGGTSFNTGSDKQTYYKLSIIGDQSDSPIDMAKTFTAGGAMHGDIALIEVTNSIREFFHLVQLGVPFPHNEYGGYVGYKTDNDPKQRATSIGPLTSQKMGECLLKVVQNYNIEIFNNHYVTRIILDDAKGPPEACGVVSIKIDQLSKGFSEDIIQVFKARNVIIATGGPAFLYKNSVYPPSQFGSMAMAILAGCKLQNLTESQFGLASTKFRWNVSGSYMQVIPRYVSIDKEGNEDEFLTKYFPSFQQLSKAIFLKGYQWPLNSDRIEGFGSSLVDLAVYHESEVLGKKIYLDFTKNPQDYSNDKIDAIAIEYLTKTDSLGDTPIERLEKLNKQAIELYQNHGIDIRREPLQIAVCNQHLNGGISGDIWWETTVKHLFAIGEINGSHGVHRPGGAALNSGQVGGLRAAQRIAHAYYKKTAIDQTRFKPALYKYLTNFLYGLQSGPLRGEVTSKLETSDLSKIVENLHNRMSKYGASIRPLEGIESAIENIQNDQIWLNHKYIVDTIENLVNFLRLQDALLTQQFFLCSIQEYHNQKGCSRGSYLVIRKELEASLNELFITPPNGLEQYKFIKSDNSIKDKIQTIQLQDTPLKSNIKVEWVDVRKIPENDESFELVWKKFNNREIFN